MGQWSFWPFVPGPGRLFVTQAAKWMKANLDLGAHNTPEALLREGLRILGLPVEPVPQLLRYLDLLAKWNRAYNITAIREPCQMVVLHVLDSLAALPHLHDQRIVDVGTGGGMPGILLAIMRPQWSFTLLDSNHKKTRFLRRAVRELGLDNVTVVCERVEKFQPAQLFDVVISRAFAETGLFLCLAGHLCAADGRLVAMKGPRDESDSIPPDCPFVLDRAVPLRVPFLRAYRQLLFFQPVQPDK